MGDEARILHPSSMPHPENTVTLMNLWGIHFGLKRRAEARERSVVSNADGSCKTPVDFCPSLFLYSSLDILKDILPSSV